MRILLSQYKTISPLGDILHPANQSHPKARIGILMTNYTFYAPRHKDEQDTSEKGQFCQESNVDT